MTVIDLFSIDLRYPVSRATINISGPFNSNIATLIRGDARFYVGLTAVDRGPLLLNGGTMATGGVLAPDQFFRILLNILLAVLEKLKASFALIGIQFIQG
ncbi:MAG: hypothetical protein OXI18_02065 [bacterium]|nr:hypothetical protein [bacterium]